MRWPAADTRPARPVVVDEVLGLRVGRVDGGITGAVDKLVGEYQRLAVVDTAPDGTQGVEQQPVVGHGMPRLADDLDALDVGHDQRHGQHRCPVSRWVVA